MKKRIKCATLSFCLLVLFGNVNLASSATTPEIEAIFNWAENSFPNLFPTHQTTQMVDPWAFRFYPSTGIYVGAKDNEVFVLGGSWGTDNPTLIDTVPNLFTQASAGDGSVPGCHISDIPTGMVITQSGNVVNITTNGQCVEIPIDNNNFCEVSPQSAATGISVLSNTNLASFDISGFVVDLPGIPNPIDSVANSFSNVSCLINAPESLMNLIVNSNICFDVTNQFGSISSVPGITITPPVTIATVSTATNQVVADCFATDAETISDLFTGEIWARGADGNFVQVGF